MLRYNEYVSTVRALFCMGRTFQKLLLKCIVLRKKNL